MLAHVVVNNVGEEHPVAMVYFLYSITIYKV